MTKVTSVSPQYIKNKKIVLKTEFKMTVLIKTPEEKYGKIEEINIRDIKNIIGGEIREDCIGNHLLLSNAKGKELNLKPSLFYCLETT